MAGVPENPIPAIDNDLNKALGPLHLIALVESPLGHSVLGHGSAWALNKGTNLDVI